MIDNQYYGLHDTYGRPAYSLLQEPACQDCGRELCRIYECGNCDDGRQRCYFCLESHAKIHRPNYCMKLVSWLYRCLKGA